jgi:hypothetical protein
LGLLCIHLPVSKTHAVDIHQRPTQIGSEKCGRHRKHSADQDVVRSRREARHAPPRPPVVQRAHNGNVVDEGVQHANFSLFRGKAVALDDGHELLGACDDGGDGEEQREDRRVVREDGEHGGRDGDAEGLDCEVLVAGGSKGLG